MTFAGAAWALGCILINCRGWRQHARGELHSSFGNLKVNGIGPKPPGFRTFSDARSLGVGLLFFAGMGDNGHQSEFEKFFPEKSLFSSDKPLGTENQDRTSLSGAFVSLLSA